MSPPATFWIPPGIPERLQLALSIPGSPPKTRQEHWDRLEFHLVRLAEEFEEYASRRDLLDTVYSIFPDTNISLLPSDCTPSVLFYALMQSDLICGARLSSDYQLGPGVVDSELQEAAAESGLEDRLYALVDPDWD
jgi:hypothetical protein